MADSLPHLLSRFIGRQAELAEIKELLLGQRLVTLTGAGGSGKTRLALAAAAQVVDAFPDGVTLTELAGLTDPTLVVQTAASAVGLREQSGQSWLDGLIEVLHAQTALLVLDNCEHLLAACQHFAKEILQNCPQVHILATSREALGVGGEYIWPVPPLSLPVINTDLQPAQYLTYDAIQLFAERATAVLPDFTLTEQNIQTVTQICRQLDGLPLAIELAAVRCRHLSLAQISRRLDQNLHLLTSKDKTIPQRQRTLTAAIAWSYELLTANEAMLLRRLAVFRGGFTLKAVEAVCTDDKLPVIEVLDLLSQLVDKSLVVVFMREPETQYRLLETVRQFTKEQLAESEETAVIQTSHATYYFQLVKTAVPRLQSGQRPYWLEKLIATQDDIRAALHWLQKANHISQAQRFAGTLRWFYYFRGTLTEAKQQYRSLIATPAAKDDPVAYTYAIAGLASCEWTFGNYEAAYRYTIEGIDFAQRGQEKEADKEVLAYLLTLSGLMGQLSQQASDPIAPHKRSISLYQAIGNQWGEGLATYWLADTLRIRREHEAARPFYERSQQLFEQVGDPWGRALVLQGLGIIAYRQRQYSSAQKILETCLGIRRQSGDRWLTAQTASSLATVLTARHQDAEAAALFQEAATLYQQLGDLYGAMYVNGRLSDLALARGDAPTAKQHLSICLALAELTDNSRYIERYRQGLAQFEADKPAVAALQITAFGSGAVRRPSGETITSSEWGYWRVRTLFFYLLTHEPQTKGELGLVFWPEASPSRLRRNLHDTLYQLRRALGDAKWVVYENGRYRFNHTLPYQYDVATFTNLLKTPTQIHLEEAIAFYQADFLNDFDDEWVLLQREQLRQQFLGALLQLGEMLLANGHFAPAATTFRQALQHDNLLEAAHRGLMRSLLKLGEPGQAARQYEMLQQLLAAELGVAPAPETTDLWQQIQHM